MVSNGIGGVPVVDDNNKLLGIVTDGDALRYLNPRVKDFGYSYVAYAYIYVTEDLDSSIVKKSQTEISSIVNYPQ